MGVIPSVPQIARPGFSWGYSGHGLQWSPRGRMPPLEDDDALVGNIIDEKAAAAGSYMTHHLLVIGTEFIDLKGFAVRSIDQVNGVLAAA
jgi:hypothetical protein